MHQSIPTLEDIKKVSKPISNPNIVHKQSLSSLQKFALWVTNHVGTMGFFGLIALWTIIWLGWNTIAPEASRFDPAPSFVLWLFISNMIQLSLLPLIMIGQNLQSLHSEARAEEQFNVNLKAEKEIETIIQHLEKQEKVLEELIKRNHV